MTFIPHFVQNELESGDTAARASAFNFCNGFDYVLPIVDGSISSVDRAQLWGLYSGISASTAPVFSGTIPDISVTENTGTHNYDLSTYFAGATSYSISPAVETGWTFNTSTAELIIDTDDTDSFGPYTITGTNSGGSDDSNAFGIEVTVVTITPNEAQREPVSGGTSSSWPTKQDYRNKKHRKILEDDEDFMRIVQEALPKILEFLRRN